MQLELATALHHCAQPAGPVVAGAGEEEAHEQDNALRGQTQPPPGMRPAPLVEVAVSQEWWPGAPRQPGGDAPSVVPPALVAPLADGIDAAALSFLLAQTLAAQQQEEVEVKEQAAVAELAELEAQVAVAEDHDLPPRRLGEFGLIKAEQGGLHSFLPTLATLMVGWRVSFRARSDVMVWMDL